MPKRPRCCNIMKRIAKRCHTRSVKKLKLSESPNLNSYNKNIHDKMEILNTPVKSANDSKEYKVIRLQNGLVACLISEHQNESNSEVKNNQSDSESQSDGSSDESGSGSGSESSDESNHENESNQNNLEHLDKEEKMAAASLCIGVGSFSDPETIQGMAHFLEHMVFMGSEKYPQENDFDSYLKNRGGSCGASTDCESTTFFFECLGKHLRKSLDKFAQFFISPLMKRDAMTREREAIDSEFQMALPYDASRRDQLLTSMACPGTPVNKFTWGNLITLRDNVSDDVLYEGVHEFRKRHYSAHRMTLAIQARLPLEVLESYVVDCFSNVPCNNLPADDFKVFSDDVFSSPEFRRLYYVKPMKNICKVEITWVLPSLLNMYKSKPHHYISWLFDDEGEGSLLSYLQEKSWGRAIYAENSHSGIEQNSMYSLFTVNIVLTPEGLNYLFEVIEAMYSYLNFLKEIGPQERIYNEIKSTEDMFFRYQDEEEPIDYVANLAEDMHKYASEDYLTGNSLYFEYNPDLINMVLEKMNPNNMNILISSTVVTNDIKYDKTEKWFSTPYTDRDIPTHWIEKWASVKPMEYFQLPEDCQYFKKNFDLLELNSQEVPLYPEKIVDTELVELWYKPDNKYKLPQAYMYYYFINPLNTASALNECMLDLLLLIIQQTEEIYTAHGDRYIVARIEFGFLIHVEGFNEQLPLLLKLIIEYMKNLHNILTEEMFNKVKYQMRNIYYQLLLDPSKLAWETTLSILANNFRTPLERHCEMKNVSHEMFKSFAENFLKCLHIQALVQGNISKDMTLQVNNEIISILECTALSCDISKLRRARQLPIGKYSSKILSFNENDCNSTITNYYQYGLGDLKSLVILRMFMLIMNGPLFDTLRTKEQLGYDVHCDLNIISGVLGFSITVTTQVQKNTSEFIDKRIESFIETFLTTIKNMSDKKLAKIKNDFMKRKQIGIIQLEVEVWQNWFEILSQEMMFDRRVREIAVINELKSKDIANWLNDFLTNDRHRRKFSIQVIGHAKPETSIPDPNAVDSCNETDIEYDFDQIQDKDQYEISMLIPIEEEKAANQINITDLEGFKNTLYLLPPHKIKS